MGCLLVAVIAGIFQTSEITEMDEMSFKWFPKFYIANIW